MVSNTADDGAGSLRSACVNSLSGDTVRFNGDMEVFLNSEIKFAEKDLFISADSNKIIINGQNSTRAFNIELYDTNFIEISGLHFIHCKGGEFSKGGAVYVSAYNSNVIFKNCSFIGNNAEIGGAVFSAENVKLFNCVFVGNKAELNSGAVFGNYNTHIVNCTFIDNYAENSKNAQTFTLKQDGSAENSLIYNNRKNIIAVNGSFLKRIATNSPVVFTGMVHIDMCPFEKLPSYGIDSIWGTEDDTLDIKLIPNSKCVNAGVIDLVSEVSTDYFGNERVQNAYVDIGAVETSYTKDPYLNFEEITVYNNSFDPAIDYSFPWAICHIKDSGRIIFNGDFEIKVDKTVHINNYDLSIGSENRHVTFNGLDSVRIFKISLLRGKALELINIGIERGNAYDGGGLWLDDSGGRLMLNKCKFTSNRAYMNGAAFYVYGRASDSTRSIVFSDCQFSNNKAGYQGGAIYCNGNSVVQTNRCAFLGNVAIVGGGIYSKLNKCFVTNSIFVGNAVKDDGGGIFGNSYVVNSTFTQNSSKSQGPAVYSDDTWMYNCLLYNNNSELEESVFDPPEHYEARLFNCKVKKHTYIGDLEAIPFSGETSPGNDEVWGSTDDELNLELNIQSQCIDSGLVVSEDTLKYPIVYINDQDKHIILEPNEQIKIDIGKTDFKGNIRLDGKAIDVGAYEFQSVKVDSISIYTFDNRNFIEGPNDSLQFFVNVFPSNAKNKTVTWKIIEGAGSGTISENGIFKGDRSVDGNGSLWVYAITNDGTFITDSVEVFVNGQGSAVVSIQTEAKESISVFPNPSTNGILIINDSNPLENTYIEIYNIYGVKIFHEYLWAFNENRIETNLPKGIYLVRYIKPNQEDLMFYWTSLR